MMKIEGKLDFFQANSRFPWKLVALVVWLYLTNKVRFFSLIVFAILKRKKKTEDVCTFLKDFQKLSMSSLIIFLSFGFAALLLKKKKTLRTIHSNFNKQDTHDRQLTLTWLICGQRTRDKSSPFHNWYTWASTFCGGEYYLGRGSWTSHLSSTSHPILFFVIETKRIIVVIYNIRKVLLYD